MRRLPVVLVILAVSLIALGGYLWYPAGPGGVAGSPEAEKGKAIRGIVHRGDTLYGIFKRYNIDLASLLEVRKASADIHGLRDLRPGNPYVLRVDGNGELAALTYHIDEDNILSVSRTDSGYAADKTSIEYEKRLVHRSGVIRDNLISALGTDGKGVNLALDISDILSWDIDFNTDLRRGDTFKVVVEGLYHNGIFKKFGNVLAIEFHNDGNLCRAYRFETDGRADYYDEEGRPLRRAFLKAPLSYRRISSHFSRRRYHPIRKICRPHNGIDYAAPTGTPVSVIGDGTVIFSGCRGEFGKLVVVRHRNGWKSYYGHLSRIRPSIRIGRDMGQGDLLGHVGATGLATGPHLHFEVRIQDRPVNYLALKIPRGTPVVSARMTEFRDAVRDLDTRLASVSIPTFAQTETAGKQGAALN
jgi:murein DD-endopeptidase MepM/ murein hydrolase activator NlpD